MSLSGSGTETGRIGRMVLFLTILAAVFSLGHSAAQGGTFSWSEAKTVDQAPFRNSGGIKSVSCPSTSFCMAVDENQRMLVSHNPFATSPEWETKQTSDRALRFQMISCPSTSLCVAVAAKTEYDPQTHSVWYALVSTDPTSSEPHWAPEQIFNQPGENIDAISCVSASLCVAVTSLGKALISTNPTAASPVWTTYTVAANQYLDAVSCPTTGLCVTKAGGGGQVFTSTNPTSSSVTWRTKNLEVGYPNEALTDVTCASESLCAATTTNGSFRVTTNPTATNPLWSKTFASDSFGFGAAVTCTSVSLCAVVDGVGGLHITRNPTEPTPGWSEHDPGYGSLLSRSGSITCPSNNACMAFGANGKDFYPLTGLSTDSAGWTASDIWNDHHLPTGNPSCPSTTFCATVDNGDFLRTSNPYGATPNWDRQNVAYSLDGVSCPTSSFCAAYGYAVYGQSGDVLVSSDASSVSPTWQSTNIAPNSQLAGISCPTASFCAAVETDGHILISTNPGSPTPTWTRDLVLPQGAMVGISCPSDSLCAALGRYGKVAISTNPAESAPDWKISTADDAVGFGNTSGIDCPSTSMCALADYQGNVVVSRNPMANFPTWRSYAVGDPEGIDFSISCRSASSCVAVGGRGSAVLISGLDTGDPTWVASSVGDYTTGPVGISCPTATSCGAIGRDGKWFWTDDPSLASPQWKRLEVDGWNGKPGVDCVSNDFCAAVDESGNFIETNSPDDPSPAWTITNINGSGRLTSISCPSDGLCAATSASGDVLISTDPTAASPTWASEKLGDSLGRISCPTTELCLALASDGIRVTTNPTAPNPTWRNLGTAYDGWRTLSCASEGFCGGTVCGDNLCTISRFVLSTSMAAPEPAWSSGGVLPLGQIYGVSCASELRCVAGGLTTNIYFSDSPDLDANWKVGGVMPMTRAPASYGGDGNGNIEELTDISCPTVGFCAAVDNQGLASVFMNIGSDDPTQVDGYINGNDGILSVDCSSPKLCAAGGDKGQIVVGKGSGFPDPPQNSSTPGISGYPAKGVALTATSGDWTNTPASFNYQWQRCDSAGNGCTPIAGARGRFYIPVQDDVGGTLKVQLIGSNVSGTGGTATSSASSQVQQTAPIPVNTSLPTIDGTATKGGTLTETHGQWTNIPTSYSYEWRRCDSSGANCSAIPGADQQTYVLTQQDVGSTIRVTETASNSSGSSTAAVSQKTAVVTSPNSGKKPIFGPLKLSTNSKTVRRGKKATFKISVHNVGNAWARNVRVCASAPKNLVQIPKCVSLGSVAADNFKTASLQITVKKNANKGKRATVTFTASGQGMTSKSARASVKVQ
ncbi:MAG: hypothetical protein K1X27_01835 [Solirubrobacterales bacterium]|nr:hypothetical protein [Solirubrobacterales bacterium]